MEKTSRNTDSIMLLYFQRRNSARIQGALEDMNLSAPSIPGRDQVQDVQDTF